MPKTDSGDPRYEAYGAMLLSRLALHARRVLAANRVSLLVAAPGEPETAIVGEAQGLGETIPIVGPAGPAGLLRVERAMRKPRFERRDRALLQEIARLFAAALEDVRLGPDLGRKISACSGELARLTAARGCGGLAELVGGIGAAVGLEPAALVELELAAMLSELRGGATTQCEVALMPGFEAVGLILSLAEERRDGHGQPYGLPSDRIPVASRILAACRVAPSGTYQ
ncbi:MAG: hypothetical protein ACJ768_02155 [Gaiellaceae bacterium]